MPYHLDRKSTRLNSSHTIISYAVFCLKKKKKQEDNGDKWKRELHECCCCYLSTPRHLETRSTVLSPAASVPLLLFFLFFFFFNDPAPPEISPFPLHAALPIFGSLGMPPDGAIRNRIQTGIAAVIIGRADRKSTRLNSSHTIISYAVFCLK